MNEPTRYPLTWPEHKPRTPSFDRKFGRFRSDGRDLTIAQGV